MKVNRAALVERLKSEVVSITFTKADGTVKTVDATLQESFLPPRQEPATPVKIEHAHAQPFWSVTDGGWRSFRWDSIISVS